MSSRHSSIQNIKTHTKVSNLSIKNYQTLWESLQKRQLDVVIGKTIINLKIYS